MKKFKSHMFICALGLSTIFSSLAMSSTLENRVRNQERGTINQRLDDNLVDLDSVRDEYTSAITEWVKSRHAALASRALVEEKLNTYVEKMVDTIKSGKIFNTSTMTEDEKGSLRTMAENVEVNRLSADRSSKNFTAMESNYLSMQARLEENKGRLDASNALLMDLVSGAGNMPTSTELTEGLSALRAQLAKFETEIRTITEENTRIDNQIKALRAAKMKAQAADLTKTLGSNTAKLRDLQTDKSVIIGRISEAEENIAKTSTAGATDTVGQITTVKSQCDKLKAFITKDTNGLPKLKTAIEAKRAENESFKVALETSVSELKAAVLQFAERSINNTTVADGSSFIVDSGNSARGRLSANAIASNNDLK